MPASNLIFISAQAKTPPVHRGCFGLGIVPTGELEGRQDSESIASSSDFIVPTGELEGRQDCGAFDIDGTSIVPTGELEGRQDTFTVDVGRGANCTNWGIGRPARPVDRAVVQPAELYQLGNWKAGKTSRRATTISTGLYQLGNWKAGKTASVRERRSCSLYQLGNWKAGKTSCW